jgi:phage terminase large subunit-like protein
MLDRGRIRQLRRQIERARSEGDLDVVQALVDELASVVNALRISAARRDPNRFIEYAFQDKHGRSLHQAAFHQRWQESIYHSHFSPQGHKRLMVVAPRDHGKTTQVIGRALWELGDNQNLRLKIACQSDSKAMERLFEITDNLERNEAVKRVFPSMVPACRGDWTKHKIVVDRKLFSKDASVEALGILSTATGGRCDMLIADDIVDRRNALQYPQIRETIKHAWKSDWTNLLEPDGRVIYICTLWHTADLSHELLENPAFAVLRYDVTATMEKIQASVALPYAVSGNGRRERRAWTEPLWDHWTKEALVMRRDEIGQAEFDRAFRNIALSGEIAVVDLSLIQYSDELPKDLIFVQGFDLAIGQKQHHNFFACVTVAVSPSEGMLFTVDAWHAKLSFTRQAAAVIEGYFAYEPAEQYMETGSYADSLPQYLDSIVGKLIDEGGQVHDKRDGDDGLRPVPLLPIVAKKPIVDKMTRLKRITPYLERGQHKFLSKLDPTKNDALRDRGDLVGELTTFPLGRDDDILDAWVMAMSGACNLFAREQDEGDDGPELDLCVRVLGG